MEDLSLVHQENFDFLKEPIFLGKLLKQLWSHQKFTYFKSRHVSRCLESKFDKIFQVSLFADYKFSCAMVQGGLSLHLTKNKKGHVEHPRLHL